MHKIIAGTFAALLSTIHTLALLAFAAFVAAFYAGEVQMDLPRLIAFTAGVPVAYILFAGITSVMIRINQNLERIARKLEDWPHHEVFFLDDEALPEPGPQKKSESERKSEPPLRREPQLRS